MLSICFPNTNITSHTFSPLLDFILIIDIYSTFTLPYMITKQAVKSINKEILLSIAIAYTYSTTESQPSHEWSRLLFSYVDLQCSLSDPPFAGTQHDNYGCLTTCSFYHKNKDFQSQVPYQMVGPDYPCQRMGIQHNAMRK